MRKGLCLLSLCFLMTTILSAQSSPSAERGGVTIWVGGEFSTFNPDYGCPSAGPFSCSGNNLLGIGTFGDFNHLFLPRLGAEAEARFLHWRGPNTVSQNTYLFGPHYNAWRFRRVLDLDVKLLVGNGHITLPDHGPGEGNYFVYAPGVTADFRLSRRWSARVGYEYQMWPGFEGVATSFTSGTGGITPNGFSVGISYAVLR